MADDELDEKLRDRLVATGRALGEVAGGAACARRCA